MVRSSPNVSSDSIFVKGWAPSVLNCVASGCGTGPAVLRRALNINEPMVLVALERRGCAFGASSCRPSLSGLAPLADAIASKLSACATCVLRSRSTRASWRDDISIVEQKALSRLDCCCRFIVSSCGCACERGKLLFRKRTLPQGHPPLAEPTSGTLAAPRRRSVGAGCGWVDGYLHQYVIAFGGVLWREHAADSAHARVVATTSIAIVVSVLGLVDGGACDAYTCSWRCS